MRDRLNYSVSRKIITGFTLIELLVVISIIALLLSILMPGLQKARGSARRIVCGSNFRQIGLGISMYTISESKGMLPQTPNNQHGYYWPQPVIDSISNYVGGLNAAKQFSGVNANDRYPSIFKCPANPDPYYGYVGPPALINISYFLATDGPHYWGNRSQWFVEPPRRIDQSKSLRNPNLPFSKVMAADVIWWWPNNSSWYGNHVIDGSRGPMDGILSLKGRGTSPGSNSLFLDGHVEWVTANKMKQYVLNHYY